MTTRRLNWLRGGVFAALAITMAASARGQSCDSKMCTGQIGRLYVSSEPMSGFPNKATVYVSFKPPVNMHALGCNLAGYPTPTYMTLQPDDPGYDQKFTLLQASTIAGKTVEIRVRTGTPNCSIDYVAVIP
jgi:hypothetical protein